MMVDRRGFMLMSGSFVAASALPVAARLLPHSFPPSQIATVTPSHRAIFKIDGWDAATDSDDPAGDQLLIRINRGWRSAWR